LNPPSIIVVAWNGIDEPLKHIDFDAMPAFEIILFNYSGNGVLPQRPAGKSIHETLLIKTEFKGELIYKVCQHLKATAYTFVGLLDDDQSIRISDLNKLLSIATEIEADVFQPSVKAGSHHSHAQFLQKPGAQPQRVNWIEIMAPFLRKEIFEAGEQFYADNISSYGVDRYLFPYLQRTLNRNKTYLIHDVAIEHLKPVTDGNKKFSNGLDARQEGELLRSKILKAIKDENIPFTATEMRSIYENGTLRWQKWKYDVKRLFNQ
jgi:hypothetical protein